MSAAPDYAAAALAAVRQNQLIKPQGSLGRLEELAIWFAGRQRRAIPRALRVGISVFAADHGVAAQGVSAYPSSVTWEMLSSLANGKAAIAVLAQQLAADFAVIDVGVNNSAGRPYPAGVVTQAIAMGTADLSHEAAMTRSQVDAALRIGGEAADQHAQLCNLLIAGEVGIGNTTSAACLISALTGMKPDLIVGVGTGIDEATRARKLAIVTHALLRAAGCRDARDLLAEVGGFEIAAMAGFYLQAARRGLPILLDGFISAAAALVAIKLDAGCRDWMLASHQSAERGHALALEHLQLKPLLSLQMRLGEGSGAALVVPLIQQALLLHRQMATFAEANVSTAD